MEEQNESTAPRPREADDFTTIQKDFPQNKPIGQPRRLLPTANRVIFEKLVGWLYPRDFITDDSVDSAIRIIDFDYNEQHGILKELADAGCVRYDPLRRGWQILPEPEKVW